MLKHQRETDIIKRANKKLGKILKGANNATSRTSTTFLFISFFNVEIAWVNT